MLCSVVTADCLIVLLITFPGSSYSCSFCSAVETLISRRNVALNFVIIHTREKIAILSTYLGPPLVYLTHLPPCSSAPPVKRARAEVERSQAATSRCWLKTALIPGSRLDQSSPPHKTHLVKPSTRAFTIGWAGLCLHLLLGIIYILCNMQNNLPV